MIANPDALLSKQQDATDMSSTYRKVTLRLIPFLFICYIVAYLDRVNVGFAKLQMLSQLQFSETVYGLGAGIFFIGYFIFEVPSNIMLHKMGARVWIARIMVTWGILSTLMMFVNSPTSFYVLRFLLGAAEAGFFPGIILYLTYWYPSHRRATVAALFLTAIPVSGVIGGPLSGWLLQHFDGWAGLGGWQWMFFFEGLPAVALGFLVLVFLDNKISDAKWLTENEKRYLESEIAKDTKSQGGETSMQEMFKNPRVWLIALIYFCLIAGLYGISFWLPSIIRSTGVTSPLTIGFLTAIPNAFAIAGLIYTSRSSDRKGERRWHVAVPGLIGCVGFILSVTYGASTFLAILSLSLAMAGVMSALPAFWSIPTAFLKGSAAAAGIALINSIGNLSGFASPYMVGWIKDLTQSTNIALYILAGTLFVGCMLTLLLPAKEVNR